MVDSSSQTRTWSAYPRVLQARHALGSRGIRGERSDVANGVFVGIVGGGACIVGGSVARHISTHGNDIRVHGLVAYTHIVGTISPSDSLGGKMVGEIAITAAPHVNHRTATRRIELNGKCVIAFIVFFTVLGDRIYAC